MQSIAEIFAFFEYEALRVEGVNLIARKMTADEINLLPNSFYNIEEV